MVGQPPPPPVVRAPKGKRHKGMILFGVVLLVGGIVGGGAMVAKSMSNYEDAVKALARAPVGCTTTLVFDKPASFTVYIETKGKVGDLSGDCEGTGTGYTHAGDKLPKVSMTLTNSKGDEIDLNRGVTATYNIGGYVGTGARSLKIEEAGTYHLNVESDDTDFAIAIGKNPKADSDLLKTIGGAVALGGLVLGLTFLLLGLRRRKPAPGAVEVAYPGVPTPGWPPGPYAVAGPVAPPVAPPMHPGFRPEPPPGPPQSGVPDRPPIRLPDQQPGTGFAPPSPVPPPPPYTPPAAPPPAGPPSAPPSTGWAVPDDPDDD